MGSNRAQLEAFLESGNFEPLLNLTSEDAYRAHSLDLTVLAHALAGELEQTLWHCTWIEQRGLRLSEAQAATVNFSLGVAYTRVSEYVKARRQFAKNLRYRRSDLRAQFFVFQGIGFFRFFSGQYRRAGEYARAALECSTQGKFAFGQLLAEELLAHCLMEDGQVRLGVRHLREALKKARALNNTSLRQSFRLLLLLSEARFGLNWDCIAKLEKALAKLHPQDSYSRNAVKLELANQWALRGNPAKAARVLDESCDSIYASRNRRHIALLNFRLAFLTWIRGRREEAVRLLKSTELHLHKEVDIALLQRIRGLEKRLAAGEIFKRTREAGTFGEDRLGDLYDLVTRKDPAALETILNERLFYFLFPYFDLKFEQQALIFDLLPKGVVMIDQGDIQVIEKGLTRGLRKILELLSHSHQSKAELVEKVWGYTYDPSRHDALIYTSISKLRQLLGRAWIEADGKGYRLSSGVKLQMHADAVPELNDIRTAPRSSLTNSSLNFRQLRILQAFGNRSKDSVGVEDVMRDLKVSRATATRDLAALTDGGYLFRLGRARATRYVRGDL